MSKEQNIEQLNQELSALKQQEEKLKAEAENLADKRERLNERFKALREKTSELRDKRDKANDNVKELKQKRDQRRTEIHEKIAALEKTRLDAKASLKNRPRESSATLQKELDGLEWKIQTTSLTLQEEKGLVEQVKRIETKLSVYKKTDQLNQRIVELQAEVKTLELDGKLCHQRLTQIAQNSQETHQKMLATIDESKKTKAEADETHQRFRQTIEKARQNHEAAAETMAQIRHLRGEIREEQLEAKRQSEEKLRGELEKRAKEKLKRGGKLTWEEFQLLAERGMEAQDQSEP